MNQTIKKRIEEINSGIVPEGYEKTSFGIFPCDWEKDKSLGDICEINPKTEALPNEFIYIDLESVVDGKLIQENVIENAKAPSRAQRVLQKNDIIYQMVRPYQKNNFIFIQDDGSFKYVASTGYAQLRSDNYSFLYQMVNSEYFCTQVLKKCTGTNYPAINSQDLAEVNCAYPKSDREQSRIAEILMQWDKAIELQEKLIEAYQKSKKYYLNKMFPKKGSNVPEIRFPGFTAPWEQRKLGDLLQTLPFKQFLKEPEPDGKYEIIQQGNEPVIGLANGTPCGDYKDVVIFGDHTLSLYKPQRPFFVATDGVRIVKGQIDTNGYYLLSLLERYKPQSEGYKRYFSILADTNCITTYNASEQKQIGVFFERLDNLITLHQQKRDKLLKQRQAMQQYLLTGIVRV